MAHIVIIGAGVTGVPMAHELAELTRPGDRITLVADAPNAHFAASNPWGAMGAGQGDVEYPIGQRLEQKGIAFSASGAKRVHAERNQVELGDGRRLDYDILVIASGPKLAFDEIEGLGPRGHTQSICRVDHSLGSCKAWEQFLGDPGPIVVGAVQGATCFGPAYESALAMETDLRRHNLRERAPITFVTAEPHIGDLGLGGAGDSRELLESALRARDIDWITNASVNKVEPGRMHLTVRDAAGKAAADRVLEFKYAVMMPAFRGIDAVAGIEGLTNARGFVVIDEFQRNPKYRNIYAAGVAVASPRDKAAQPGAARTGYTIESMVTAVAQNIRDQIDGREPVQTAEWSVASFADLGQAGVAVVAQPQSPPQSVNWFSRGEWAHLPRCASCDVGD